VLVTFVSDFDPDVVDFGVEELLDVVTNDVNPEELVFVGTTSVDLETEEVFVTKFVDTEVGAVVVLTFVPIAAGASLDVEIECTVEVLSTTDEVVLTVRDIMTAGP